MKAKTKRQVFYTLQAAFIIVIMFFSIFASTLFPGSEFSAIVDRTFGKFFDVSSFFTDNYIRFVETLAILVFVWILRKVITVTLNYLTRKRNQKTTGLLLLHSAIRFTSVFLAAVLILSAWGVSTTALLASVGILGFIISFGAQGLVEDMISGLFLIIEKQFSVGDIVIVGDFRGSVLEIGLRTTKFLDGANNDIKILNNSDIRNVINASSNLSKSVCDMSIEYGEDLVKVEQIISDFLPVLAEKYPVIEGLPEYLGVQTLDDSAVIIRIVARTLESNRFQLTRTMNREFKLLFDQHNINIPYPQLVLHKS